MPTRVSDDVRSAISTQEILLPSAPASNLSRALCVYEIRPSLRRSDIQYISPIHTHTSTLLLLCFTLRFLFKTKLRALLMYLKNMHFLEVILYSYLISFYFFFFFTQVRLHQKHSGNASFLWIRTVISSRGSINTLRFTVVLTIFSIVRPQVST